MAIVTRQNADTEASVNTIQPRRTKPALWMWLLWTIAIVALAILVVLPVGFMAISSIFSDGQFSVDAYKEIWTEPRLRSATINSLIVALTVGIGSVVIATPLALGVARTKMRGKKLVQVSVIVAIISPDFLVAMAFIVLMGPNSGYLNKWLRDLLSLNVTEGPLDIFTVWGFVFIALPRAVAFVFLLLVPAFKNADPALEEAARISGSKPFKVLASVTLPILRPALVSGALVSFALAIAMFGTPYMLNVNVLPIAIRQSLIMDFSFQTAASLSMVLTVMCVIALFIYQLSIRKEARFRTVGGKSFEQRDMNVGGWRHVLTSFALLYALLTFVLPYGTIVLVSFMKSVGQGFKSTNFTLSNYAAVFDSNAVASGFKNSFVLSVLTATILTILTPIISYLVIRAKTRYRRVLDYLSILPMGIPGTAVATALMIAYLNPPLSKFALYGTIWILLLAYLTNSVPFGVRMSSTTLLQFSPELEEASRVAGASQLTTLLRITVPMMKSTLIYVWMLVFILTFPEMSSSVILAGIDSQTAATVILDLWAGSGGLAQAAAASTLMFIGVVVLLGSAQAVAGRSRVKVKTQFV